MESNVKIEDCYEKLYTNNKTWKISNEEMYTQDLVGIIKDDKDLVIIGLYYHL